MPRTFAFRNDSFFKEIINFLFAKFKKLLIHLDGLSFYKYLFFQKKKGLFHVVNLPYIASFSKKNLEDLNKLGLEFYFIRILSYFKQLA